MFRFDHNFPNKKSSHFSEHKISPSLLKKYYSFNLKIPLTTTASFKTWLKENTGMKLYPNNSDSCLAVEGINDYEALLDFDKKSLQSLPTTCKVATPPIAADATNGITAKPSVADAIISLIPLQRIIVALNAIKCYNSIGRAMNPGSMHWINVLTNFQLERQFYESLKEQDGSRVPFIGDKDSDRKVIKWFPIFLDCLSCTFGSHGPLSYVLCDHARVRSEAVDPLQHHAHYGSSGSLLEELNVCLSHT